MASGLVSARPRWLSPLEAMGSLEHRRELVGLRSCHVCGLHHRCSSGVVSLALDIRQVRVKVKMALSDVYNIRMGTPHDRWTPEQVELITRIEADLVKLQDSLKAGWQT